MSSIKLSKIVASAGLVAVVAGACVTNPVTGRKVLSFVSPAQEQQIGAEGYQVVLQEVGEYSDAELQAYVETVGMNVARVSHQPELEWRFTLLDDPTVNAFAMPGGYIYVTRGMLVHLNSEAQLAGVLGHEIAHVTARHSATRMTQQQLAGLGFGLATIFSEGFRRFGDVAQVALELLFLRYSRADETEADELAVQYAINAGYDPREIPGTYTMLQRVTDLGGQRLPTFLATHPDPGDRRERTAQLARRAVWGVKRRLRANLVINALEYNEQMNGVVYGQDPRDGYFDGNHYYHPKLGFQVAFPDGWRYQDTRTSVVAIEPDQAAGMQLTLADAGGSSPAAHVSQLGTQGAIVAAEGDEEQIGGFPAWIGIIAAASEDGQPVPLAAAFIRKADDQMFQFLGQSQPGDESLLFASMRSFRGLTDPARIHVTPARVRVAPVERAGTFADVVAALGTPPSLVDDSALLNTMDPNQSVVAGALIKYIVPGSTPAREGGRRAGGRRAASPVPASLPAISCSRSRSGRWRPGRATSNC